MSSPNPNPNPDPDPNPNTDPDPNPTVTLTLTRYPDTGSLQGALVSQGNAAAAKYPKLDKILSCSVAGHVEL